MISAEERVAHMVECLLNLYSRLRDDEFAEADYVMTNTPGMLRSMGGMMTELGLSQK